MTATESTTARQLAPFFSDTRTVAEKLNADRRTWIPSKPDTDSPATIGGLVLEVGTYSGFDRVSPTLTLLDADGTEWQLIAFHGFLRTAVERQKPAVGDWAAITYLGTKPASRSGESDPHVYRLIVERNPDAPVEPAPQAETPAEPEPAEEEALTDDDIPF